MKTAIELLDATECIAGNGQTQGCVYYAAETRLWYAVTPERLEDLQDLLTSGVPDAYSLWCADGVEQGYPTERDAAVAAGWK